MKTTFTSLVFVCVFLSVLAQEIVTPEEQKSLVIKHSATWCPPCGLEAWNVFEALVEDQSERAVFLQAHISRSSVLYSPNAEDLLSNCDNYFFQPEFFHNTTRIGSGSIVTRNEINNLVNAASRQSPMAQTGIVFAIDPLTRELRVRTKTRFFRAAQGVFRLSVLLTLKDTIASQASRSAAEVHKHVLVSALTEDTFGEVIADGVVAAGAELNFNLEAELPADISLSKTQIVTVLWQRNAQGKYDLVNANIQDRASELSTSSRRAPTLDAGLSVSPSLSGGDFFADVELPAPQASATLALFNLSGQPAALLHRGPLGQGKHRFSFQRPAALSPGIYALQLRLAQGVIVRKVALF
jgi:hypothetical protein